MVMKLYKLYKLYKLHFVCRDNFVWWIVFIIADLSHVYLSHARGPVYNFASMQGTLAKSFSSEEGFVAHQGTGLFWLFLKIIGSILTFL